MALSLAEEQELVRRAQNGDEQAFEEIIRTLTPSLFRVVQRLTGDAQESEAVVQEAFWRAWRAIGRYQNDRPLFPYLVTIATNIQRDRWRSDRRLDERDLEQAAGDLSDDLPLPETQLETSEMLARLEVAIQRLPRPYRVVIALRYEAELSYEEIARALDLPLNTVRTHLRRARQLLRDEMEKWNG